LQTIYSVDLPPNETVVGVRPNALGTIAAVVMNPTQTLNSRVLLFGASGQPLNTLDAGNQNIAALDRAGNNLILASTSSKLRRDDFEPGRHRGKFPTNGRGGRQ
jgi:hypothetical protein